MQEHIQPQGMTDEQFAQAKRVFEVSKQAVENELWNMACLAATKSDDQLLGKTEFEMRDMVHRIGAKTLENVVNERRKKGGTWAAACRATSVNETRNLSIGDLKLL